MMIKTTLTCALTLAFLTACAPSRNAAPSTATARDSLDWAGSYEGVLPCADCPGIRTRVTLSDNGRYESRPSTWTASPSPKSWPAPRGNPTAAPSAWTPPATASATSSAKTS